MESPGDREGRGVPWGYVEQQKVDIPPASMAGRKAVVQWMWTLESSQGGGEAWRC